MDTIEQKATVDTVIEWVKNLVASKRILKPELWIEISFRLNLLLGDEHVALEDMRSYIAKMKLEVMKKQEKRNVAEAKVEVEASDEYKAMKIQEHKVDRIEEFIRIAKINGNQF